MPGCSAPKCHNRHEKGYVMLRFPKDATLREKWRLAVRKENWHPTPNDRLCEVHFDKQQWLKFRCRLKEDAVPTLFCTCQSVLPPAAHKNTHSDHTYAKASPHAHQHNDHLYMRNPLADRTAELNRSGGVCSRIVKSHSKDCDLVCGGPQFLNSYLRMSVGVDQSECAEEVVCAKELVIAEETVSAKESVITEETVRAEETVVTGGSADVARACEVVKAINQNLKAENKKLRNEIKALKNKIKVTDKAVSKLQNENIQLNKKGKENENWVNCRFGSDQIVAAVTGETRGRKWGKETVKKALQLRFSCGSAGYNHVAKSVMPLPSIRTLQRNIKHISFQPGILTDFLDALATEVTTFNQKDKVCALFFDEMAIKSRLDFDPSTKQYIGHETVEDTHNLASKAQVYMFGGVHRGGKIIAGYNFLPSHGCPESISRVLLELLKIASAMGLDVIAVVCDMGNRDILSSLGFSCKKDEMIFCIPNPVVPGKLLFCVPDIVHVFKSLKEMLCNNRIILLPDHIVQSYSLPSNCVKVEHIEWLEEYQQGMDVKFSPKLKAKNVHSNHFDKMRVSNATNVINSKTSGALSYLVSRGSAPLEFETTAFFIEMVNKWFDLMTSRSHQLALSKSKPAKYEEAIAHLKLVIHTFCSMSVPGGWKPVQTHLVMATQAILAIQDQHLNTDEYDFVLVGRFLQDIVDNLFSVVRLQRPNPTPVEFKYRLKQCAISHFMTKVTKSSYSEDDREFAIDVLLARDSSKREETAEDKQLPPPWCDPKPDGSILPKHQEDILYRMFGYIVRRLINSGTLRCNNCIATLKHTGPSPHNRSGFTLMTNYSEGAQFEVSDEIFQIFRAVESNLQRWKPFLRDNRISTATVTKTCVLPGLSTYSLSTCHDVKEKLVSAYVTMRIKQFSSEFSAPARGSATMGHLASKSMGSRLLADRFKIKASKSSSMKRLLNM